MTAPHLPRRALLAAPALLLPWAARAEERLSIRLDFGPWGVHAALHLAEQRGWFREAGIGVDIQDGRGSGNTLQLVNAGQVDVGQVQLGLLPAARQNGAKVTSFAGFGRRTDLSVMVERDGPIRRVQDCRGKTLVCFAASPWAPLIDPWLKAGGLDRSTVNILFVDPAALWTTYTMGRADGLMSVTPSALPFANKSRPSRPVNAEDVGIAFPSYGLIATEDVIRARSAVLAKVVQIQQRAWAAIATDLEAGVTAMLTARPDARLDREVTREQIRLTIDFFETPATQGKPLGWQAEEDWQRALHCLQDAAVIRPGWRSSDFYSNALVPA